MADSCTISVDRRLTAGEDRELALQQIKDLPAVKAANAEVTLYSYDRPSYTGLVYPTDSYFPSWVLPEEHVVTRSAVETYKSLFKEQPRVDKWTFSTNGVSIMGMFHIPCIGFGPGKESRSSCPRRKDLEGRSGALRRLLRCVAAHISGEERGIDCEGHGGPCRP